MHWIHEHFLALIEQYGVIALFVSLTLETLGLPMPGESALIASAAAACAGTLSLWHVAAVAYLAAFLGDNIGYLIGRRYGRAVIIRYGARLGITDATYRRAEDVAEKYGPFMVVGARFVVLLRQLNGLVAGSSGMHWAKFLGANLVGAAIWVGLWTTLGYRFGHDAALLPWIWRHLALTAMVVVPALLVVIAVLYMRLRRERGARPTR